MQETDENDRRKRENHEKQFNISEFVDSRAMKFVEKLLNGNQTGDFLAQVKGIGLLYLIPSCIQCFYIGEYLEQTKIERPKPIVQEIQTTVEPHTVDVPASK